MSTDIAVANAAPLSERVQYAQMLASAGDMLPDALRDADKPGRPGNPAKIMLVMETARVLGVPEIRALDGIDVIHGSATLGGELIGALVRAAGHRMRVDVAPDGNSASAEITRRDDPDHTVRVVFSMADAEKAGLLKQNPNWAKYPADMLVARASTRAARRACPEVLYGITPTADILDERDAIRQRADDARTFPPRQRPDRTISYDEASGEVYDETLEETEPPAVLAAGVDYAAIVAERLNGLADYEDQRKALQALDKEVVANGDAKLNVAPGLTVQGYIRQVNAELKEAAYGPRGTVEDGEPEAHTPHEQAAGGDPE